MPPYSKLQEYLVQNLRAIVDNPRATVSQRLSALGKLEKLRVKRKPRKFGKQPRRDPELAFRAKAQSSVNSKLLGISEDQSPVQSDATNYDGHTQGNPALQSNPIFVDVEHDSQTLKGLDSNRLLP